MFEITYQQTLAVAAGGQEQGSMGSLGFTALPDSRGMDYIKTVDPGQSNTLSSAIMFTSLWFGLFALNNYHTSLIAAHNGFFYVKPLVSTGSIQSAAIIVLTGLIINSLVL